MWNIKIFSIKSMPLGKLNLFKYISNKNKYVTLKKINKERKKIANYKKLKIFFWCLKGRERVTAPARI